MNLQLSNNEKIVHAVLEKSSKPLKAYSILLKFKKGIKSPTQVYRALDS